MVKIEVHEQSCRGCQMCIDTCPTRVFAFDEVKRVSIVRSEVDCLACLTCAYQCPSGAIAHSNYHVVKNFYRDADFSRRLEKFL